MIKRLENEQKHCIYAFQLQFLEVLPDYRTIGQGNVTDAKVRSAEIPFHQ